MNTKQKTATWRNISTVLRRNKKKLLFISMREDHDCKVQLFNCNKKSFKLKPDEDEL